MKHSPKIITRIWLIASLTMTLTFLGAPGHTERIKLKDVDSTPTYEKSELLQSSGCSQNNVTGAYYWEPPYPYGVRSTWKTPQDFENAWVHNGVREGTPGEGDTVILDARRAGADKDFILLDQNRTVGTLIICGYDDNHGATLRSTAGNSHTLTVTDRFEWNGGRILDGTVIEAAEVIIHRGSLGYFDASPGLLTIKRTGWIDGPLTVSRGSTLTVERHATLTFANSSPVVFDGANVATGTLNVLGTAIIKGTGGIAVNNMYDSNVRGPLDVIKVSGTLDLKSDAGLSTNCHSAMEANGCISADCDCGMTINAGGQLVKSAGAGASLNGLILNNSGKVSAKSGTLAFSKPFTQNAGETVLDGGNISLGSTPLALNGGVLAGVGTVTGNVTNASIVQPGYPQGRAGQLTITGDYTQTGKLEIDIGGTTESRFDQLVVNRINVSGPLDISLINNFSPTCNDSFDIVKYVTREGQFSVVNGINLSNGRSFTPDYQPADTIKLVAQVVEGQDTDSDGVFDCDDADDDNDGDRDDSDCAQIDPAIHHGATEVCNGLDDDCDGLVDEGVTTTFYQDADGDGYGNAAVTTQACSAPAGNVADSSDCNDLNLSVHPGATEICDGLDNDCDSSIDEGSPNTDADDKADCADTDDDNDGWADPSDNCPLISNADQANNDRDSFGDACDPDDDNDGGADSTDCEPFIPTIHQFASEVCNGVDDDCDGAVDEGLLTTFYRDADGDGYGNASVIAQRCTLPSGYVANNVDCNDSKTSVHPNATEICDGFDNDCDSSIDEGWTNTDADGQADCADTDDDDDGLADKADNCPLVANRNQADSNGDGIGDVCTVEIVFESYRDGNGEIYGMRSDGTGVVRLTNNAADDSDPTLSQDRTKIAFVSDRDGNREIYSMNLNNTGLMRLTTNDALDVGPSWSPDGSMLVFTSLRDGNLEIYSMDATGGNPRNLTNNRRMDFEPDWGSNGKIAFVSNRDGPREIYSMDIDGSDVQRLTDNAVEDSHPSWAPPPNDKQIVFTSFRDGNSEIYVMKADGSGTQRQTINPAFDTSPAWGANGEIAFVSNRDGNFEIYSMIRNRRNSVRRLTNQRATDHGPDW